MSKWLARVALVLSVVAVGGLVWATFYRQRATQAQVTRAVYAEFGTGPRIICASQDRNGESWNCRSVRWGDDPACRQASVSWSGTISISHRTVFCEG
jgi:hypothetical protein